MFVQRFLLKKSVKAALSIILFAAFILYLPASRKSGPRSGYGVSQASLQTHILNDVLIDKLKEIHGMMVTDYDHEKIEYYFEYEANAQDTLRMIASLPVALDNRVSSVQCIPMESSTNPLEASPTLPDDIREKTAFFWNSKAEDFIFYECVKSTMKHTLLISKTSSRILHKVETI